MNKYSGGGDIIHSLNTVVETDGRQVELSDIMTDADSVFAEQDDPIKKDMYEQLVKDSVYRLIRLKQIDKIDGEILLHSHGIDEFFPKKTAMQIGELYKLKNTEVRTRRFNVAKKVANVIRNMEHRKRIHKHWKEQRMEKRISIRISNVQFSTLDEFCQTKGQDITTIMRMALNDFLAQNLEIPTLPRI